MGKQAVVASLGVGASVLFLAGSTSADCRFRVLAPEPPAAWTEVIREATARTKGGAADCSVVELTVRADGGALVTFTTTDGRRAARDLMSPDELVPTLEALLITFPLEPSPVPAAAPKLVPAVPAPQGPARIRAADPGPEVHFIAGAAAGVRFGFSGAFASPAIALRPTGTFGTWDLAGVAEYAPFYSYLPGREPPGFALWSFAAGLQVGRRETLQSVALGYGLGFSVGSAHQEANETNGASKSIDVAQPRFVAYGRLILPSASKLRAVFGVDGDVALGTAKKRATERLDTPNLPRFGLVISVGAETSLL